MEREPQAIDRLEPHQMSQLDHVAQGVTAGVPGFRDALWHVRIVDLGTIDPVGQAYAPAPLLDRDFSQVTLTAPYHPENPAVRRRVDPSAKAMLADYASHGFGTSREEASLTFPDVRIEDSPNAGDQRSEGPVASNDNMAFGDAKCC